MKVSKIVPKLPSWCFLRRRSSMSRHVKQGGQRHVLSTTFARRPSNFSHATSSREYALSLTLKGALHVRDTVASAHEGAFDEEEHPRTRGGLRAQSPLRRH